MSPSPSTYPISAALADEQAEKTRASAMIAVATADVPAPAIERTDVNIREWLGNIIGLPSGDLEQQEEDNHPCDQGSTLTKTKRRTLLPE
jgi:hypothetical protein